ncbi:MAG: NADP-specific glutamate dehydrogenase [Pseudomonadota bacterium]
MKERLEIRSLSDLDRFLDISSPHEPEFQQAVKEVAKSVIPLLKDNDAWSRARVLERLIEPDRIISFQVAWEDDDQCLRINRGYRVQTNNAVGPYKGGLRFHPSVSQSVLKFLGFEQIFKNSLTGLPLGAGKGGADFDPSTCSDREVMRFCRAYMAELVRHIGEHTDVPAGDIGVGAREIGYLYGAFVRLQNRNEGSLTGKGASYGGSPLRPEATGYGVVYFAQSVLAHDSDEIKDKVCAISGAGNVALHCADKLIQADAKVVSLSDSGGTLYAKDGFSQERVQAIRRAKEERRVRLAELAAKNEEFLEERTPWEIECDLALPCATQNELGEEDADRLVANGCAYVVEGANMPVTAEAYSRFEQASVTHLPGKAANAGGVAVSGFEMAQNRTGKPWTREQVDKSLREVMKHIHSECVRCGEADGGIDYGKGANVAGFERVAAAMLAQGF